MLAGSDRNFIFNFEQAVDIWAMDGINCAVSSGIRLSVLMDTWMATQEQYGGTLCFYAKYVLYLKKQPPITTLVLDSGQ